VIDAIVLVILKLLIEGGVESFDITCGVDIGVVESLEITCRGVEILRAKERANIMELDEAVATLRQVLVS